MSKKVVKNKKSKLIKTRLFTLLFAVMFIVSLFTGIKAFAETGPFKLNSATISDKTSGVTGSISSFNDSEVINDITFHKLDDYATFKFELKSNLNREITILEITDDNSNSYIAYEYDKHENEKLASNGTLNFIVKAVYKTELTDTSKRNQTNNVIFTIKYLDNGEEKTDEIIVNPKTGDGISKSIIMLIISSVGLITCITLDKKRKSKKLSKLSVLILTGLVLSPIVVKAATFAYEITLKSTIGLYDKVVVTIDDKVNPVTTQTIDYNTKIDSLPSPTKEGYTLTKWTVGTSDFDIDENITSDITIEANYRKNNYTIRFAPNVPVDGELDPTTSMNDIVLDYDEERNLPPIGYLVTGYNFDSWNTMPDGTGTKYEDMDSVKELTSTDGEIITLYARWGATPYTVIFDKNHSNATGTMNNISKAYGETFNLPKNKYKRTGYNFNGWNTSPMADGTHYDDEQSVKNLDIDGEITLYAEWSPTIITISFDKNSDEATGTMSGQIVVYDIQNSLSKNTFTREHYDFNGWNTEPDGSGTSYDDKQDITNEFDENITLYAQWGINKYTIIYNKNNNNATGTMNNQVVEYNETTNLHHLGYELTGYNFIEWNTEPDGSGTGYTDEQEIRNIINKGNYNLYAQWEAKRYTITYNSNESTATGTMTNQVVIYGETNTIKTNNYKYRLYSFINWNTEPDGSGNSFEEEEDITNTIRDSDLTLYAQWEFLNLCNQNKDVVELSSNKCTNNLNITVGDGILCKRATKLHESKCAISSSPYCKRAGYNFDDTITYGSCGTHGTLTSGDAFTCDIDGNGYFNEFSERFYYVSDYYNTTTKEFDENTAVLIYYNDFNSDLACNNAGVIGVKYWNSSENWHGIQNAAISKLPSTSLWNTSLNITSRQTLTENGGTTISGNNLPVLDYSGHAARILTAQELGSACGFTPSTNTVIGGLDSCEYMLENTTFTLSNSGGVTHGFWLETPEGDSAVAARFVNGDYSNMSMTNVTYAANGIRPVIDLPKSKISY